MKRILTNNLKRSAERYPDRVAFKQMQVSITYEDLVAKSNQVARQLIANNIKTGDRVGIIMNRSVESCYAVYGIMMAGAAYVPIDSNLPAQRIQTLINDCGITTIITKPAFAKLVSQVLKIKSTLRHVIGLKVDSEEEVEGVSWEEIFALDSKSVDINLTEQDIAYIIYTSGTTGHPKGIVHTHYSGGSYAKLSADLYQVSHTDILGNHSHLHYDISTMGYLTMPYAGGCTVIVPEAHTKFPASLAKLISEEQMTIWYSVPLALIQMLDSQVMDTLKYDHLRWILFGGEVFSLKHIDRLRSSLPHVQYSNVYGPAEVNQCTYYNFDQETPLTEPIPLGKVWPETDIAILGDDADANGELIVASSTQMHGYWNQESKTKASFINKLDPTGTERRYYKTGDIGSRDTSGDLHFTGREDRQVKVRGYRVELNEIESLLIQYPNISEAAVYTIRQADANVIYANIKCDGEEIDQRAVKQYLSSQLPLYSVPEIIKQVTSIPRTTAGKVDYKSLIQ